MRRSLAAGAFLLSAAALLLAACATAARAHSVFSIGGLGEPQNPEPARLRALGGAGAAEQGPRSFSLVNPASLADVEQLVVEGTVLPAWRRIDAATRPDETANETTFPSLRAVVALPGRLVAGGAYVAGTSAQFRVDRDENSGAPSHLRIDGSGGMNFVRLSLARRISPALALGVDYDVVLGSYREEWTRTFDDTSLVASRDTLELSYRKRGRLRLGVVASRRGFTLGAAVEAERSLPLTMTQRTAGASVTESKGSLTLPTGFTLGLAAPVGGRVRAVAQYARASWSRASLASDLVDFRPQQRVSVGLERKAAEERARPFLDRLPVRVGAYYLAWPDRLPPAGALDIASGTADVNEWGFALGSGLWGRDREGSLDCALEAGWRGDRGTLGAREYFVRFGISLLVSDETWKGSIRKPSR
ncbi:MAG TPA: hypothetical protein VID50_05830 [Candidatus Eisenbacteria bacterium]